MLMSNEKSIWEGVDVISAYSRAEAIDDGVLVDLMQGDMGKLCKEHYKYPIACTSAVWGLVEQSVSKPEHLNDVLGVLHDILTMSKNGHERSDDPSACQFQVIITGTGNQDVHDLKMRCGPGDEGEPVLTLMLVTED
jgi:hypothetical protein